MISAWVAALDALEADVARIEEALVTQDWLGVQLGEFVIPLHEPLPDGLRERASSILARFAQVEREIERRIDEVAESLRGLRPRSAPDVARYLDERA